MTNKSEARTLAIVTHILGLFTGFIGALIIVLVTEDKLVKNHARRALNWQISNIIYNVIGLLFVLTFIGIVVGVPILLATFVLNIVFSIIAAVRASNNILWKYPISIPFLKDQ